MVHCNVMIYNEILFLNYHRSSYADKLPEMLLSQMAINIFWVGPIIRVQFSGWQLFGGTQQQSIILRGNSLSTNIPRANYLGNNFRADNFLVAIIRGANKFGRQLPRGQLSWGGGQLSGGQLSEGGQKGLWAIVWGCRLSWVQLSGWQFSGGQLSEGQLSCSRH